MRLGLPLLIPTGFNGNRMVFLAAVESRLLGTGLYG